MPGHSPTMLPLERLQNAAVALPGASMKRYGASKPP